MFMQRLLLLMLVGATLALTPLAQASPPDQTWLPGLYDDADYDDVVRAVTASVASLEPPVVLDSRSVDTIVAVVTQTDESRPSTLTLSSNHTRPPPVS
jgi:hypothetical protein